MAWPTTMSDILKAAQQNDRSALEHICEDYRQPVYQFLLYKMPHHNAEDITQEFFLEFLQKDWVKTYDGQKGKFRTLLLTALNRFVFRVNDRRQGRFENSLQKLEEPELEDHLSPEFIFHISWVENLLSLVKKQLEERMGTDSLDYQILCRYYFEVGDTKPSYSKIAEEFQVSKKKVHNVMARGKSMYQTILQEEVLRSVNSKEDVREEIQKMIAILSDYL